MQSEQLEANRAEVNSVQREVVDPCGAEHAPILPPDASHVAEVFRFLLTETERYSGDPGRRITAEFHIGRF